jgi:hypothetical protein
MAERTPALRRRRPFVRCGRPAVTGTVLVAALVLGGCGDDEPGGSAVSDTRAPATTIATAPPPEVPSPTSQPEGGSTPAGPVPWAVTAADIATEAGATVQEERVLLADCPGGGPATSTVRGSGPSTDDSAVCVAAVHAGLITSDVGGTVTFGLRPGLDRYGGTTANGVTTLPHGSWGRSFVFLPEP